MAARSAGAITISLEAITKGLESGLDNAKKSVSEFGNGLKSDSKKLGDMSGQMVAVGGAAVVMGGAIMAGLNVGVQAFSNYGKGIAEIQSLIPNTGNRIKELDQGIRELSGSLGIMPNEATKGMYNLISAFGDSDESLKLLEINAKAAKAGVATLSDSIALTSAVTKTYGDTSAEAQQKATDLAFTAVKLGQTTFPELASSIGAVTPLTKELGVSQEELFAIMGAQTGVTGNASEVTTQFRGVLQGLMSPTDKMSGLLQKLGFENGQAMIESLGLKGSISAITDEANATGTPLQGYLGSIEAQTLALSLAGENGAKYDSVLAEMGGSAGATDQAFEDLTTGFGASAQKTAEMEAKMELAKIAMGEALLPITLKLTEGITNLVNGFTSFASQNPLVVQAIAVLAGGLAILGTVGVVLGGVLSFITTMMTLWGVIAPVVGAIIGALSWPIVAVIAVIGLLVAAGIWLWQNWEMVVAGITNSWNWFVAMIGGGVAVIGGHISAQIQNFQSLLNFVTGAFTSGWNSAWNGVSNIFGGIWNGIKNTGRSALNGLLSGINNVIRGFNSISGSVGVPAIPEVRGFASGGYTGNNGISEVAGVVHGQEYVLKADAVKNIGIDKLDMMNETGNIPSGNSSKEIKIVLDQTMSSVEDWAKRYGFVLKKVLN